MADIEYKKDFQKWLTLKALLDAKLTRVGFFKERDIWWVCIGCNVGFEIDGKSEKYTRPVLVLKKFNSRLFLGIPLSTKLKNFPFYMRITLQGKIVSIILSQTRVFSVNRIWNKLGEIDTDTFQKIQEATIETVLSPSPKRGSHG